MNISNRWSLVAFMLMVLLCCSDPVGEPPGQDENPNPQTDEPDPDKANALMEAFVFASAKKVAGSAPSVTNTELVKTGTRDTIFSIAGIKDLIRLSHPEERPIKGIYIAAQGSTFYYDVPVAREEKSDTVSVIIYEVDPEEIEEEMSSGSVEVPIEIIAYDDQGQLIDIIERILAVEKPSTNECDILEYTWHWEWSGIFNHNDELVNLNARGERNRNSFIFKDCCKGAIICPYYDENDQPVYDVNEEIDLHYTIDYEWFEFYSYGNFYRETAESASYISNIDKDDYEFDACQWEPEIQTRIDVVSYYGTHDYTPGSNTLNYTITNDSCGDDFGCGYGSRGGDIIYSCHAMIITFGPPSNRSVRLYKRDTKGSVENEILDRMTFWP
jgi:hypothetical protein